MKEYKIENVILIHKAIYLLNKYLNFLLSQEREKIREEEERKLEKAKQELETKLNLKEMQLQEMIAKQNALEEKLNDVYKEVPEIKGENAHLIKERDTLQRYHFSSAPTENEKI